MENIEPIYFNRLAYVQSKVSGDVLEQLKNEAKFILANQNQFQKHNNKLAGNLEKEYLTDKSKEILEADLITLANEYHKYFKETQQCPNWKIQSLWINFQKKYEHNPIHNHAGDLSFVLWISIPYDLKEELSLPNCKNSNTPVNSLFEFVFTDFLGRVVTSRIDVDKSYEGTIIMFPSTLNHTVHPFYTSDDYRISISGNLVVAPPKPPKNTFSYQ
jgi:hypothetical protein